MMVIAIWLQRKLTDLNGVLDSHEGYRQIKNRKDEGQYFSPDEVFNEQRYGQTKYFQSKVLIEGGHVPAVSEHHDPVVERYEACLGRFTKLPAHSVGTEGIDQIQ